MKGHFMVEVPIKCTLSLTESCKNKFVSGAVD